MGVLASSIHRESTNSLNKKLAYQQICANTALGLYQCRNLGSRSVWSPPTIVFESSAPFECHIMGVGLVGWAQEFQTPVYVALCIKLPQSSATSVKQF